LKREPRLVHERVRTASEDGCSKAVDSDIGFCRAVEAAGPTVAVNYRLPMAHVEQSAVATRV